MPQVWAVAKLEKDRLSVSFQEMFESAQTQVVIQLELVGLMGPLGFEPRTNGL